MSFNWQDPLLLDEQLSDDEILTRDTVRRYCREHLMPRIQDAFRDGTYDRSIMTEFGNLGMLGATISGCNAPGMSHVACGLIASEL